MTSKDVKGQINSKLTFPHRNIQFQNPLEVIVTTLTKSQSDTTTTNRANTPRECSKLLQELPRLSNFSI